MATELLGNSISDIVWLRNCGEVAIQESSDSARHCLVVELERVADVDPGNDRERVGMIDRLSPLDPADPVVVSCLEESS